MQIQFTDLDIRQVLIVLERNGFGMVKVNDPFTPTQIESIKIWTARNQAVEEAEGFECGRVTRQFGHFPRYDLMIDDGRVSRTRCHGLMTDLLNASWRA